MTRTMNQSKQPISILLCALGGEGGGVLAEWLADSARRAGYPAQATSIPGVAQRTGATTYYLEFFPVPLTELAGKRPVFGLNPLPGRLDLLVSSELAGDRAADRQRAGLQHPHPGDHLVIAHADHRRENAHRRRPAG
jgi:Pyruvate/2-oxoacid:ferredoxin oxidoreductase gamma subunit